MARILMMGVFLCLLCSHMGSVCSNLVRIVKLMLVMRVCKDLFLAFVYVSH